MIYILHFSGGRLGTSGRNSAGHYLGWAPDDALDERLAEHRSGHGARITAAAVAKGLRLDVAATYNGDRTRERKLKNNGHFDKLCPVCRRGRDDAR